MQKNKVMNINQIISKAYKILKNAEIDNFKMHDLRHTFATHAASLTKDIRMVQQSLGHTTLDDPEVCPLCRKRSNKNL